MELLERLVAKGMAVAAMLCCGCSSPHDQKLLPEMKWYDDAALQLHNDNGIFKSNGIAFTGTVYSMAPNKKDTVAVGSFADGKESGEWRKYFDNGQLMERRYYFKGKKVGVYEAWWPNSAKRLLYHFENGEYEGSCKDWNDKGVLMSDMHFHEGHEAGEQKQFYDDGKVKSNYVVIDGRRYGLLGTKNCVNVSDSVFNKKVY
jgi:antitoxin component YwqK of YwqJK toxin-antitoxin module